jgi:hypothetical protein
VNTLMAFSTDPSDRSEPTNDAFSGSLQGIHRSSIIAAVVWQVNDLFKFKMVTVCPLKKKRCVRARMARRLGR